MFNQQVEHKKQSGDVDGAAKMELKDTLDMQKFKEALSKANEHQKNYLDAILKIKEQQLAYNIHVSELEHYNKIV